jgi:hypothetical protein
MSFSPVLSHSGQTLPNAGVALVRQRRRHAEVATFSIAPTADWTRGNGIYYRFFALKVSQALTLPFCNPLLNQRVRWALVPWVKLSGTT